MQEKSYDIPLHDIKTIVEVQEYSLYYFSAIALVLFILLCVIIYFIYKWFKNKNLYNQRKEYFKFLNELDLNDTKKSAYAVTFYGDIFKNDSDKHLDMFEKVTTSLEQYKYKKDVNKFDKNTLINIEQYRKMINV